MARGRKAEEGDEPLSRQSLKAAIWYTVTKIAQEEELSLPFAASEHFVAALAEVVFQQALTLGKDLESFAKHAGRLTINAEDVKLASRRNEPMYESLTAAAVQHGLTLADLRADSAPPRAGSSKPKAVKAPRLAASKAADQPPPKPAAKPKKTAAATTTEKKASAKGKGKAKAIESDDEEDASSDSIEVEPKAAAGGFVKASDLKKGKRKAAISSSDEAAVDSDSGGLSDSS
ncbi:hypothetical protein BMF94_5714 [Rhodotorula taiwanensis]|uniref:Centromere protein S n=1 Tax=Rhodotorula taiwanensis TaxID=741276 RepID=A0A2S5B3N5_9BASI|nr:hypothetical protein BMF94_5714 [Rhodotorula taiwanensis]